jgi:hypothetical protein
MELEQKEADVLASYLAHYDSLIGDTRTKKAFQGTIKGIIGAESLVCARIAVHSPELAASKNGEQRVRRMVGVGEQKTTKRSSLDAASLIGKLRERGLEQLQEEDEVWAIYDSSDLRKPYANEMESLMAVRTLDGKGLVNGYRTLNVIGVGKKQRGVLYHHLFSSTEEAFVSESVEVQQAFRTVIQQSKDLKANIINVMDSGFDDIAVWGTIWEAEPKGKHQLVCRLKHLDRWVEQRTSGQWRPIKIEDATNQLRELAVVETDLVVRKGKQTHKKLQPVKAHLSACHVRVPYQVDVRTRKDGAIRHKEAWIVRVELEGVDCEPWYLITDIPVVDAESAIKVFRIYRQRWAVEDVFKVSKECLGWEDVQLLKLDAVRNLVACAWVATGFIYELGVTFEEPEIRLLARLGGWEERQDPERRPGKIVLMRGLRRLLDQMATEAILADEIATYGQLPPRIAALLRRSASG